MTGMLRACSGDERQGENEVYHYRECGLGNVWLANGYDEHSTPYGEGVSIDDAEGLQKVIDSLAGACRDEEGATLTLRKDAQEWRLTY